jgi:hypothetical protein
MLFAGKWMEVNILLGRVNQAQKVDSHMFSLMWKQDL